MSNNETAAAPQAAKGGKARKGGKALLAFTISKRSVTRCTEATEAGVKADGAYRLAAESLHADGASVKALKLVKGWAKGKNAEAINTLKGAIVKGLPAEKQRVMAADVATLSEGEKALRKEGQQNIGRYYALILSHLLKIENGAGGKRKKAKGRAAQYRERCDHWTKALQEWSDVPKGVNITEAVILIAKLKACFGGK